VNISTRNSECGVVAAHSVGIRSFQEAIDMTVGIVEQLHLADPELVHLALLGLLRDLEDCIFRQLQVLVEVHELGHLGHPFFVRAPKWSTPLDLSGL
jgi:hypothetical protein